MESTENKEFKTKDKALLTSLGVVVAVAIALAIVGFIFIRPVNDVLEGQAEAASVKVAGKLPGRLAEFYVQEGERVSRGDTLARIHSSVIEAKMAQAEAMHNVAEQQNRKVDAGVRMQMKNAAYQLWQQAMAAEKITKKTYERMETLFSQGVISEQKRDEARAAFDAATAASSAAKSQYELAEEGAQLEDKEASASMVKAAQGTVDEVKAIMEDQFLVAPCDGEVSVIYPEVGELIMPGAPIMSVMKIDEMYVTFNVREEYLNDITMGSQIDVKIPALNNRDEKMKVYFIRDLGSYAVWSATKATGEYDSKTFEVKMRPEKNVENLRPGMTVIIEKK